MNSYVGVIFGLFMFHLISSLDPQFKIPDNHEVQLAQGKMQYEIMKHDSHTPRYGSCWKNALASLEHGCRNLDDEMQSRLSLAFTNCFLAKVGMRTYPCLDYQPMSECLKNVDNNAFTSYSNFFTHTQNMCYFLMSQMWHEETEKTIDKLAKSSAKVSESIEDSSRLQDTILTNQQVSLDYQRQLVENGTYLSKAIEASKSNVKDMMEEFRVSTGEQRNMIFEVFDRVSTLQNLVVSEVNWLYTIVFYGISLLACYLLTATNRTSDARLCLFLIISINFAVEHLIVRWSLPDTTNTLAGDPTETIYYWKWISRYVAIFVSCLYLAFTIFTFKDYNRINNSLLQEIKRQNLDIRRSMESFQVDNKRPFEDTVDNPKQGDVNNWERILENHQKDLNALLAEDTGFAGDEEDWSDDSDSFNSTKTDRTFDPGEVSDQDLDDEDNSPSTPTNKNIDSAMEALSSGLLTSNRDIFLTRDVSVRDDKSFSLGEDIFRPPSSLDDISRPSSSQETLSRPPSSEGIADRPPSALDNLQAAVVGLLTPAKKVVGRPRGSQSTPKQTPTDPGRTYFLRNRSSIGSPQQSPQIDESPETFARKVKEQLGKTRRMATKMNMARRKAEEIQGEKFSSDE